MAGDAEAVDTREDCVMIHKGVRRWHISEEQWFLIQRLATVIERVRLAEIEIRSHLL